jgi:RhoGAP domain
VITGKEKDKRKDDKKHKFPRLGRKGSVKDDDCPRAEKDSRSKASESQNERSQKSLKPQAPDLPLKTAPLDRDRGFREMMNSTLRNRSADRYLDVKNESSDDGSVLNPSHSTRSTKSNRGYGREETGPGFLSSIGNKAAGGLGRVGKGLAKLGRSGSTNERELVPTAPKEPYVLRIITLPLIEQTRITRISKRLEDCRDKTEFWMPALPWRCIDFLNAKAPNSEGIYRVPGSDRDIKHWEQRFDRGEPDINLSH